MNNRRTNSVWLALLAIGFTGMLAGCHGKVATNAAPKVGEPGGAIPVEVAKVGVGDMEKAVSVTGSLAALQDVQLSAKVVGRVVAVNAREGDIVHRGEVLVQQDTTDLDANVREAQADVESAVAKLSQAYINYRIGVVNANEGVLQAKAQVAQAQENYLKLKRGPRPEETLQARDTVDSAKASADNSLVIFNRDKVLYDEGAIAKEELEQAQTTYDVDLAQYNNANEALQISLLGNREEDINAGEEAVRQQQTALRNAIVNREDVSLRKDDIVAAQAAVDQAKATLAFNQQQVANAYIASPIDGVVAERDTEIGQEASPASSLMRIVNLSTVYYEPSVSETDIATIHVGDVVDARIDALNGQVFPGRVTAIYPAAATGDRTFMLRVTIENPNNVLRPGMFARGEIVTVRHRDVPIVPASALVADAAGQGFTPNASSDEPISSNALNPPQHVVIVGPDGKAYIQHVVVGIADMERAEIVSGLKPGETIVVVGQTGLKDGDKLAVVPGS